MPLSGILQIKSTEPSVIAEAITRLVSPCEVITLPNSKGADYSGAFAGWQDFALGSATSASGMEIITKQPTDTLIAAICETGRLTYFSNRDAASVTPGQTLLCDASRVTRATFSVGHRQCFLAMPIAGLKTHLEQSHSKARVTPAGMTASIPANTAIGAALRGLAPLVAEFLTDMEAHSNSPVRVRRYRDAFMEIFAFALFEYGAVAASSPERSGSLGHVRAAT